MMPGVSPELAQLMTHAMTRFGAKRCGLAHAVVQLLTNTQNTRGVTWCQSLVVVPMEIVTGGNGQRTLARGPA
jgi:hypothetical protein